MTESRSIQRVAVALFEGFTVLDVYGPVQAFASSRIVGADGKRQPLFQIFSMAAEAGRVKAGEGPASWAEWSFEKAPDYDILLIPGGFGTRAAVADQAFVERVAAASRRARITTTVCTGSAILARTGLLDGRPATSNKIAWDWVVQQGPRVLWKRKARWVDDGNVLTSSGVSAGIDMALSLVARLHGREMALDRGAQHGIRLARGRGRRPVRVTASAGTERVRREGAGDQRLVVAPASIRRIGRSSRVSGFTMSPSVSRDHRAEQRRVVRSAQHHRRRGAVSRDLDRGTRTPRAGSPCRRRA